uniref:valine--tRNA ligase n=1 Tax=Bartheletia paradoxa TaxID=669517 RepID=A0A2D0XI04_9BASI|nr:hypothetical protein SPAR06218 [Bartheletia paradoxa]
MTTPVSAAVAAIVPPSSAAPAGEDAKGPSKSALKKEAKRLEAEARKAAKANVTGAAPVAGAVSGKPKTKIVKEVVVEEEYVSPKHGEKKDLSGPQAAAFNPAHVEDSWYAWWESQNLYDPYYTPVPTAARPTPAHLIKDPKTGLYPENPKGTFVVPAPPPNVTGSLHIGHALTIAIQDSLVRYNRMKGLNVLFNPGYDHAGISTQSVVEKRLYKDQGLTRHDLGRDVFLKSVWAWKDEYQKKISDQLRRLGASYDWNRTAFTMDDKCSKAVAETFCKLHEDGIIYRANRLVNWCVALNTTLSNLELDQKEIKVRTLINVPGYGDERIEFGAITSFAYPLEGSDEKIIVATTRPETMLGDTAIAVHPDDARYTHLHGKFAVHPFNGRRIPIITDSEAVKMEFGTGAVKMTPAHSFEDYEVGKRHNLEFISILNDDGTLNANAGVDFVGMKRLSARKVVVDKLKELGLYIETKDNEMSIPICAKSGDIIEPVMKPQWWVNCKPLAAEVIRRTKAGELKITPQVSENDWYRWLETIQDWCISRQLWWGHRCPAYFVRIEGEVQDNSDGAYWVVGRSLEEATTRAEELAKGRKYTLEQDEDVLDTWFSSGLWPFAIMGWPEQTADLKNFYPSALLETGWDILFFWVARMAMLGVYLTGQMPFKEVFCHAMIRDAHGRKMSKSLGNVIDPIDVIEGITLEKLHAKLLEGNLDEKEIKKAAAGQTADYPHGISACGTDALRFTLCNYTSTGRDINLAITTVEAYRKFCNKMWNATKFAMMKFPENFVPAPTAEPSGKETLVERWILSELNTASILIAQQLEDRNLMGATETAYNFWLKKFCDVFIEAIKPITDETSPEAGRVSAQNTLYTVLDEALKLIHPFMPYVTEELWQRLPRRPEDNTISISRAAYPEPNEKYADVKAEEDFELVITCIRQARAVAKSYGLLKNLKFYISSSSPSKLSTLSTESSTISALVKGTESISIVSPSEIPAGCGFESVDAEVGVHLLLLGEVDAETEIAKLEKKIQLMKISEDKIKKSQESKDYEKKIPEKLETYKAELESFAATQQTFIELQKLKKQ